MNHPIVLKKKKPLFYFKNSNYNKIPVNFLFQLFLLKMLHKKKNCICFVYAIFDTGVMAAKNFITVLFLI